jgi:hypothetical protein
MTITQKAVVSTWYSESEEDLTMGDAVVVTFIDMSNISSQNVPIEKFYEKKKYRITVKELNYWYWRQASSTNI